MDYSEYRHLEHEVLRVARDRGYDGSPFVESRPPLGTEQDEWAAVLLSLAISPRPATPEGRELVRKWSRNIVLSSGTKPSAKEPHQAKARAW